MSHQPEDPFSRPADSQQPPAAPPAGHSQGYAPQYAQPPGYGAQYPAPGPNPATAKNWMNTTALVLSLSALLLGITAIGGIIFGHLGLAAAKRGEADNRGMGLAGVIIGYTLLILGIIATVALIGFFGWIAAECGGSNPAAWCEAS